MTHCTTCVCVHVCVRERDHYSSLIHIGEVISSHSLHLPCATALPPTTAQLSLLLTPSLSLTTARARTVESWFLMYLRAELSSSEEGYAHHHMYMYIEYNISRNELSSFHDR